MRKIIPFLVTILSFQMVYSQVSITNQAPYNTAQYLINDVFAGGNVTINNIQVYGSAQQYGFFSGGGSSIGIDSGLVLSTGSINELCPTGGTCSVTGATAPGNGTGVNFGPTWMGSSSNNALLSVSNLAASLIPGASAAGDVNDACVIWFEFVPTKDTMQFNFIFASNEWPTYPCSSFNDVFGFFVSGPGVTGTYAAPAGFPNSQNYAVIPGTNIPITISSINGAGYSGSCGTPSNSSYFVPNPTSTLVDVNAFTTLMTVEFPVQPCDTYSFAMAIGDGSDGALSSFVFMEANSFDASGVEIIPAPQYNTQGGDSILFEGCGSVDVDFHRLDNVQNADTIPLVIAGTALMGADYTNIPDSIVFAAGQDTATISFSVIEDYIAEGIETIIIGIADSTISLACGANGDSLIIEIHDRVPLSLTGSSIDTVWCTDASHLVETVVDTGMLPATYAWSNGSTTASFNLSNTTFTNDTSFLVTVTGACGVDSIIDTAHIIVQNPPTSILCPDDTITCEDMGAPITVQTYDGMPGMVYQWSSGWSGSAYYQNNPYVTTDYVVTATQACAGMFLVDTFTLTIDNPPFVTTTRNDTVTCIDPPVDIAVEVTNTTPNFTFQWSNGVTDSVQTVNPMVTTDYYVTVTDACGVNSVVDSLTVWVINDPVSIDGENVTIQCVGDILPMSVEISGGYQPYSVLWNTGETDSTINVTTDSNTIYTVSVTDVCQLDTQVLDLTAFVATYPDLQVIPFEDVVLNCPGRPFEFGPAQVVGGSSDYVVSWTNWNDQIDYFGGAVDTTTTFTFEVADLCNLDSVTSDVTVTIREHDPMVAVVSPDTMLCPQEPIQLWAYPEGGGGNYSYSWSNGDNDSLNAVAPLSSSVYSVTITDDCGTRAVNSVSVEVSAPTAIFTHQHLDATNVIFANGSENATSYTWDFGDGNTSVEEDPWHTYNSAQQWYVTLWAYDDHGCVDSAYVILDPPLRIFIPSAFTPDGDGLNDVFQLYGEGYKSNDMIKSFLIVIFDRWGNEVFSSRDANFQWDGSYKGSPASVGVYVYKVRVEGYARQKFETNGTVTIPSYTE